ncbi:MAG: aldehyde dehydrogenase family protein, partial [Trebonia sp.]|uniref:aldehyde dehydrogenase family protein n=1 Tax=Trebonia sp. TaxID=2767075 RepID=UPI003BB1A952
MTLQPPRTVDLFVSGRWQPSRAGQYEPATSPVTGELIGHVAQGDRADAGAAVQAASAALGGWA